MKILVYLKSDKPGTSHSAKKSYDPTQFSEGSPDGTLKEAQNKIRLLEFDYKSLHDKRLQDVCYYPSNYRSLK